METLLLLLALCGGHSCTIETHNAGKGTEYTEVFIETGPCVKIYSADRFCGDKIERVILFGQCFK